ncbi:hypothetical protein MBLNU457_g0266t1 [Dothideomycetes sp. NU457]
MLFKALTLLVLASTSFAKPLAQAIPDHPGQNTTQSFLIKTHLLPNQSPATNLTRFDNLWLSAARTGAGTSDAVLTTNITDSLQAFFTIAYFPKIDTALITHPSALGALNFVGDATPHAFEPTRTAYDAWSFVQIINGEGGGVVWKESLDYAMYGFKGWMVCDWWHGLPQLFVKWEVTPAAAVPMGCADVELRKVWI